MTYLKPWLIVFYVLSFNMAYGQDTLKFGSKELISQWEIKPQGYLLKGKIIKSVAVYGFIENIVNSLPSACKKVEGDTCQINNQVLLTGCSFNNLKTYYTKLYFPTSKLLFYKTASHFTIEDSRFNGEPDISNIQVKKGHLLALNHNVMPSLTITDAKGWFSIYNNQIDGKISIQNSHVDQLDINEDDFGHSNATEIDIGSSQLKKSSFVGNNFKNIRFVLTSDTLNGIFDLNRIERNNVKTDSGGRIDFVFKNCLINSQFIIADNTKAVTVEFVNCTFDKNVNLDNFFAQRLIFNNCNNFAVPLDLNTIKSAEVGLSFINSDLKNFRLNYLGKFNLFFPDSTRDEDKISTFENLLAKFKLEGKLESFQNVDILYTQYKNSKSGLWGFISDTFSRWWWFYSYRKYYILFWTAGMLLVFYIINIRWWSQIKAVYPIIAEAPVSTYYNSANPDVKEEKKSLMTIFVFTAFIFFSLRINFEKLDYKNSGMLTYFFIQYILGLVCVFFIVNAILKI